MEQEIKPQQLNPIPPNNKNKIIVTVVSLLVITFLATADYLIFSKRSVKPVETQTRQSSQSIDSSDWKTYRNEEYGFEVQYPGDWSVYSDKFVYLESKPSDPTYPRFSVTEPGPIKDSKCYASFIFKDTKNPDKYSYNLYSETDKKQRCQITLDSIVSTFKLSDGKQATKITLHAYEKDGNHIFDGAVIAAIDTSTGKIVAEQIADRDGRVVFSLIPGAYRFQPSPLRENRVVGLLNLFVPLEENKPQTLSLTEIGPSSFGAPVNTCEEKQEAINLALEQANYCEVDSDCKLFQPGGFSCYVYTHQSFDGSTVLQRVNDYGKICRFIAYKCAQLVEHSPACIQGKCYTGR